MSFGLKLLNSSGDIQIDGEYSNYNVIAKGTIPTAYYNAGYGGLGDIIFPSGCTIHLEPYQLIAVRCLSNHVLCSINDYQNNVTFVTFTSSVYVEYILLEPFSYLVPSDDNYGLRIFSSEGDLIFDSGYDFPKFLLDHTITKAALESSADYNIPLPTLPAGRHRYLLANCMDAWRFRVSVIPKSGVYYNVDYRVINNFDPELLKTSYYTLGMNPSSVGYVLSNLSSDRTYGIVEL